MKRSIVVPLVVAVILFVAGPAAAHEVWLDPSQTTVEVGNTFDLLMLANVDSSSTGFSLQVNYDHDLMVLNSSTLQSYWFSMLYGLEVMGDTISAGVGGAIAPSGDNMPMAILHFTCLAPGSSMISLSGGLPGGYAFAIVDFWFPGDPTYYEATFSAAHVDQVAAAVPEPGTLALLGLGIVVLGLSMFRRKRDNAA